MFRSIIIFTLFKKTVFTTTQTILTHHIIFHAKLNQTKVIMHNEWLIRKY